MKERRGGIRPFRGRCVPRRTKRNPARMGCWAVKPMAQSDRIVTRLESDVRARLHAKAAEIGLDDAIYVRMLIDRDLNGSDHGHGFAAGFPDGSARVFPGDLPVSPPARPGVSVGRRCLFRARGGARTAPGRSNGHSGESRWRSHLASTNCSRPTRASSMRWWRHPRIG